MITFLPWNNQMSLKIKISVGIRRAFSPKYITAISVLLPVSAQFQLFWQHLQEAREKQNLKQGNSFFFQPTWFWIFFRQQNAWYRKRWPSWDSLYWKHWDKLPIVLELTCHLFAELCQWQIEQGYTAHMLIIQFASHEVTVDCMEVSYGWTSKGSKFNRFYRCMLFQSLPELSKWFHRPKLSWTLVTANLLSSFPALLLPVQFNWF